MLFVHQTISKTRHLLTAIGHRIHHHPSESVETTGLTIHWARWYDPFVQMFSLGRSARLREMTGDLAQIDAGQIVLDIGCGTGQLTQVLHERVGESGRAIGVDASAEMIAVAQQKHPAVDYRLAAVEQLPFEDNTFDVVVSSLVLHHLPGDLKAEAMREVRRVLKAGGRTVHVDFGLHGNTELNANTLSTAGFINVTHQPTRFRALTCISGEKPV